MAAQDQNTLITHVYGIAGLIPGIVSIIYLVRTEAGWREYALVLSGWVAASFYGFMLLRAFKQARDDWQRIAGLRKKIGSLTAQLEDRESELANRNATLDYLAGLQLGRPATPRVTGDDAGDGDKE